MCCDYSARLVVLSRSQEQQVEVSSMALARVIAKAYGVDCLVADPVKTLCHDL